ncbi:MAG: 1,4-dihydroxy-6-naphthoate synthase [Planctomycetota bacterium]
MRKLRVGISTCPNDTFAFHALIERKVVARDLKFEFVLLDVQALNDALSAGEFDIAKASFHAALLLSDRMVVLPVGAAVGFGAGPLLLRAAQTTRTLARRGTTELRGAPRSARNDTAQVPWPRVLCPGASTTATLLFKMFFAYEPEPEHVVFSSILPTLARGEADFGVCIHEGRFTYSEYGLECVADLGSLWEIETQSPLPLGGLLARRALEPTTLDAVTCAIRESLDYATHHRAETFQTMKRYAQELEESVIWAHVDLYVSAWTRELGEVGRRALAVLSARARATGIVPDALPQLEVWNCDR